MQAMSNTDVNPGTPETQQMRVVAPAGVSYIKFLMSDAVYHPFDPPTYLKARIPKIAQC